MIAYALIVADQNPEKTREVLENLREIEGVSAGEVTGPDYNIIAEVEAKDQEELKGLERKIESLVFQVVIYLIKLEGE